MHDLDSCLWHLHSGLQACLKYHCNIFPDSIVRSKQQTHLFLIFLWQHQTCTSSKFVVTGKLDWSTQSAEPRLPQTAEEKNRARIFYLASFTVFMLEFFAWTWKRKLTNLFCSFTFHCWVPSTADCISSKTLTDKQKASIGSLMLLDTIFMSTELTAATFQCHSTFC